jgi:tetratricopeptide (TPR) repeat protein/predicted Ser/Thr protein kinase
VEPERWRKIEQLYLSALEREGSSRAAFVDQACGGDEPLRREVESLLAQAQGTESFLESPALEVAAKDLAKSFEPGAHPSAIGRYRIVRLLGEGGMGTVYEAEQEEPRRVVALKVIKFGFANSDRLRRFRQESQALARLQHPGIAQIYEFNTGDTGFGTQPFFAMELIRGLPLLEYAASNSLNTRQRCELMLKICEAVSHAHQHLVIHRDIKPANVLVTGDGTPKLLDFGIAKLLDAESDGGETTIRLTPDYASPEQLRGRAISTASDVYSLGVLLYELVAGRRPYKVADTPMDEAIEKICVQDPPPPRTVSPDVPEDLDAIIMKALRKEPESRYASVREFAEDIDRYLGFRPVLARKGTYRYVARKFVRRHRAAVVTCAAAGIFLAASATIVIRETQVARYERDRAQRRFDEVRRLAHSVIFDLQDKIAALPGSTPVRKELIASAIGYVDRLAKEAAGDSGLQQELAEAYMRIGEVQGGGNENLGDLQGSLASFQKAEQIARALAAAQPSFSARKLLVNALRGVGLVYTRTNDSARAESYRKETLAMARKLHDQYPGNEDATILLANSLYDMATLTRDAQSLGYRLEALPIFEELLKAKPSDPSRQRNAGLIHKYIGGYWLGVDEDQALPYLQRALSLDEARLANDPGNQGAKLDLSFDYSQLGSYYLRKHDLPTAIEYQRKTLAIRRDLAASDPKDVWKQGRLAFALTGTARLLLDTHDYRAALANLDESRRIGERLGASDAERMADYAFTLTCTAYANRAIGNGQAACEQYSKARDLYRKLGYSQSPLGIVTKAELETALATCAR